MSRAFLFFYYIDVHLRTKENLSSKGGGKDWNRELALGYDPDLSFTSGIQLANGFAFLCHSQYYIIMEMGFLKMNMTQEDYTGNQLFFNVGNC